MNKKKYFAFISYSHKDSELAKWLQHEFEYYELPATLFDERKDLHKEDLPQSLRPVFRDDDELADSELKPQVSEALADSEYLIVVCSPFSAQSLYVDNEIREFISLSQENKRRIFPFIVDGKPHQDEEHKEEECFPKTLLELSEDKTDPIELIAGDIDIHEKGRDHAFVKILAGTLNDKKIHFADLWDRYAIEKAERERKEREDREKLQIVQSRFLAENANGLVEEGDSYMARMLVLIALPKNLQDPERPYVAEAEAMLSHALQYNTTILRGHTSVVFFAAFSQDGKKIASASGDGTIRIWDVETGTCIHVLVGHTWGVNSAAFSPDGKKVVSASKDSTVRIWDTETAACLQILEGGPASLLLVPLCLEGNGVVLESGDNTIRIWDFPPLQKLIDQTYE